MLMFSIDCVCSVLLMGDYGFVVNLVSSVDGYVNCCVLGVYVGIVIGWGV